MSRGARLRHLGTRWREMSKRELVDAVTARLTRPVEARVARWRDARRDTRAPGTATPLTLEKMFHLQVDDIPDSLAAQLPGLADHIFAHRFDLLGSGWVAVRYGMRCRGLEGIRFAQSPHAAFDRAGDWLADQVSTPNLAESQRLWRLAIEPEASTAYEPIDWQLDFKSGYRWSAQTWYRDIRREVQRGRDLKVPWELARMQHLPVLASVRALAAQEKLAGISASACDAEFRAQILDFLATNPPRYGVNWACPMDIGIRLVNWLVARDLFLSSGAVFDAPFEAALARSVYEHGRHILRHLEGGAGRRGNHYLADVAGLLFAAAYLPATAETDAWLAFGVQEIISETGQQFHEDGSHCEASVCYHRLSAEMVAWSVALTLGLPESRRRALREYDCRQHTVRPPLRPAPLLLAPVPGSTDFSPFPDWFWERLEQMGQFATDVTKPSGQAVQVGDHDSGRFVKLHPLYECTTVAAARANYANLDGYEELADDDRYLDEEHLDFRPLLGLLAGLVDREDWIRFAGECRLETRLIRRLIGAPIAARHPQTLDAVGSAQAWQEARAGAARVPPEQYQKIVFAGSGASLLADLTCRGYPDFGLYIFRSPRLYLAVRCGASSQRATAGHAHADQLAIELQIDGRDVVRDPGTYLYTPLPERRNEYREAAAHFVPAVAGHEPAALGDDVFSLGEFVAGTCLYVGSQGFCGEHERSGLKVRRVVSLEANAVVVEDWLEARGPGEPRLAMATAATRGRPFSKGYGIRATTPDPAPPGARP